MTEAELLVAIKNLHQEQERVLLHLTNMVQTFFEDDEGDIDRALAPALALEAVKTGDFSGALRHLGGAE